MTQISIDLKRAKYNLHGKQLRQIYRDPLIQKLA